MPEVVIQGESLRARVVPELGAGLAELSFRSGGQWAPILRPAPAGTTWFNDLACYLLAPWPNRIEAAGFCWNGRDVRLDADWPDATAIHGLVKERPWAVQERSSDRVRLSVPAEPGTWPWAYECTVEYGVEGSVFHNRLSVRSVAEVRLGAMPCGVGFHPFFAWPPGSEVRLRVPVRSRYPLRAELPTGAATEDSLTRSVQRGRTMDSEFIDDVFQGGPDGATIEWPSRGFTATMRCSPNLGHTVIYSRGAEGGGELPESFCLEPVSMVNNGFRLAAAGWHGTGVVELQPGEAIDAWWSLEIDDCKNRAGPR